MNRYLHLELILGTRVVSAEGRPVGRIEEVRAGKHQEIVEFLVGQPALLSRLSALGLFPHKKTGYRIRWDQLDWSDWKRPKLTCPVTDLERL
jgi:sporulation protein YlmC with PRC-barrel domain